MLYCPRSSFLLLHASPGLTAPMCQPVSTSCFHVRLSQRLAIHGSRVSGCQIPRREAACPGEHFPVNLSLLSAPVQLFLAPAVARGWKSCQPLPAARLALCITACKDGSRILLLLPASLLSASAAAAVLVGGCSCDGRAAFSSSVCRWL